MGDALLQGARRDLRGKTVQSEQPSPVGVAAVAHGERKEVGREAEVPAG